MLNFFLDNREFVFFMVKEPNGTYFFDRISFHSKKNITFASQILKDNAVITLKERCSSG